MLGCSAVERGPCRVGAGRADDVITLGKRIIVFHGVSGTDQDVEILELGRIQSDVGTEEKTDSARQLLLHLPHEPFVGVQRVEISAAGELFVIRLTDMYAYDMIGMGPQRFGQTRDRIAVAGDGGEYCPDQALVLQHDIRGPERPADDEQEARRGLGSAERFLFEKIGLAPLVVGVPDVDATEQAFCDAGLGVCRTVVEEGAVPRALEETAVVGESQMQK